jgi:membrane-bound lytic murein transglycosylase D
VRTERSKLFYFLLGVLSVTLIMILTASIFLQKETLSVVTTIPGQDFPQGYKIISPYIPDKLDFAGEKVPMENFEVREGIEREFIVNTYFHSLTVLAIKRANRWFPVIEPILRQNNIPNDFKYLCVNESNLENVISPAKATGFWQFIKDTGKKYNLEINRTIDERYHVEKSTQAACDYLNDAYNMYGSWTVAAASYNMGTNGTTNQIERQQTENFYNLVLNPETSRYVARIVAFKYIMENQSLYGFDIKRNELYEPLKFYEVMLDSTVTDFANYATSLGINYKTLKLYNPWLRDNYLNNKRGKIYKIKVPKKGSIKLIN